MTESKGVRSADESSISTPNLGEGQISRQEHVYKLAEEGGC